MLRMTYLEATTSYDVEINAIKENVIEVSSTTIIPVMETGFTLTDGTEVYDYSLYKTLYRKMDGKLQYSNNGEVWSEPTKVVTIMADWEDDEDILDRRPDSVKVTILDNEQAIGNITLKAKNDWMQIYKDVPVSHTYTIVPKDVDGYTKEVEDTTVVYTVDRPYEPSVDEQLSELTDMVTELDERVYALEEG